MTIIVIIIGISIFIVVILLLFFINLDYLFFQAYSVVVK